MEGQFETGMRFSKVRLESEAACALSQTQVSKKSKGPTFLFSWEFINRLLTHYCKKTGKVDSDLVNLDYCCFLALCVFS